MQPEQALQKQKCTCTALCYLLQIFPIYISVRKVPTHPQCLNDEINLCVNNPYSIDTFLEILRKRNKPLSWVIEAVFLARVVSVWITYRCFVDITMLSLGNSLHAHCLSSLICISKETFGLGVFTLLSVCNYLTSMR